MKILHLSDLHIGKVVNEISMLSEQKHILEQILSIVDTYNVDAVMIAGDVYDKGIPSIEAVQLFNDFFCRLGETGKHIFIVGGNHDSAERLDFASPLLERVNIHIYTIYDGTVHQYEMNDEYGAVRFYLMPFVKPPMVRSYFENTEIKSYNDAFETALSVVQTDNSIRNIMIAHQYVTDGENLPTRCDSEIESIGGLDNIDAAVFDNFDYVALGHLHRSQYVKRETIRYCGSPLKYSASEVRGRKTVVLLDLKEKGKIEIQKIELCPLHDMVKIEGNLTAILDKYEGEINEDYAFVTLTDETDLAEPVARLRTVFKNLMSVDYKRSYTTEQEQQEIKNYENMNPIELLEQFYRHQNNMPMNDMQTEIVEKIFSELTEEQEED
ncbi:MAG: exonuclease SbcCD subunit D [Acutalibacteraceae bacterium]